MNRYSSNSGGSRLSEADLRTIITSPDGAETLVSCADSLGKQLKELRLSTNQIRSLFGEVRQIEAEWSMEGHRQKALRRLLLLKPKMAYRARRESGGAVRTLVDVLDPAVDLVAKAKPRVEGGSANNQDDNFQRFVEFFEAILAYHKAHGGN